MSRLHVHCNQHRFAGLTKDAGPCYLSCTRIPHVYGQKTIPVSAGTPHVNNTMACQPCQWHDDPIRDDQIPVIRIMRQVQPHTIRIAHASCSNCILRYSPEGTAPSDPRYCFLLFPHGPSCHGCHDAPARYTASHEGHYILTKGGNPA